jgi:hypothetical protein
MAKNNRLRRALRAFDRFTLLSFNASPYNNPYTDQMNRPGNGPRVF